MTCWKHWADQAFRANVISEDVRGHQLQLVHFEAAVEPDHGADEPEDDRLNQEQLQDVAVLAPDVLDPALRAGAQENQPSATTRLANPGQRSYAIAH